MPDRAEISRLRELIADIPGWLTDEEGEALYELAKRCTGRGVIVEIGSWKGKSTTCLGLGSRAGQGVRIFAVDPHADYRFGEFKDNIDRAGIADLVTPVPSTSQAKADDFHEPIELLFIDGSHKEEMVRLDWRLWAHRVLEGGWIAMHDTTGFVGPKRVAEEEIYRSGRFRDVAFVYPTLTVGRRASATSGRDRLRARYALALKRGFETLIRVRRRIPAPAKSAGRALLRRIG